jgi:DNA-binding NtrC family response regulator
MKKSILIVEDSRTIREIMREELESGGHEVVGAASAEEALTRMADRRFDIVLTDLVMPGMDGLQLMEAVRKETRVLPVVVVTAHETSADAAIAAIRRGASDYLIKPLKQGEALFCVNRILRQQELEEKVEYLSRAAQERYSFSNLVGRNPVMQSIYDTIEIVAETDSTVLVTGETGTGKELVARALHWASPRRDRRFITINCSALPAELLESELFGHEKGAFTGAIRMKVGKFEYGDGGTVFLDEIGEIPPLLQVKILRVLQEREFERVGGNQPIKVDVRIIAATNKDLPQAIARGEFREDLYYRLNVVPLRLPPLRARREDIPLLARHFLLKCREKFKKEVDALSQEALNRMLLYPWPGNVRELENVIERAVIMARGPLIQSVDLPEQKPSPEMEPSGAPLLSQALFDLPLDEAGDIFERSYCEEVLARCEGRIATAARHSGLNPRSFNRKMNKYGLDKKNYKRKKTRMAGQLS